MDKRRRPLYALIYLVLFMSFGHHVDHAVRGNDVGWPLTGEVNAFTYSLTIYPLILIGLLLYARGSVGPGFWVFLSGGGVLFVSAIHFGPWAVEPPSDIIDGYELPIVGWFAFGWLLVFVGVLAASCVYESREWWSRRAQSLSAAG